MVAGQRAASVLALIALLGLALAGCPRGQDVLPEDGSAEGAVEDDGPATGAEADQAESAGLAGPGATIAEAIEVTDEGPASPVILVTASMKGYTEPCGCTLDLVLGGLDRVVGFVQAASALGTDALVLDGGDLWFEYEVLEGARVEQDRAKAALLAEAHRTMGTFATVPGPRDLALGVDTWRELVASAEIRPLAANLALADGSPIAPAWTETTLDGHRIGVIGAVDPARFAERTDVTASDAAPAVDAALAEARGAGVDTTILLFQGDLSAARATFGAVEGLDFIVIGSSPRDTDEVERVGSAWTLEAYDQGRYVGRLKLVWPGEGEATPWQNARVGSDEEAEQVQSLLERYEGQLAAMPPVPEGEEPPAIRTRLEERIAEMQTRLEAMESTALTFADGTRSFAWEPWAMAPGIPTAESITTGMLAYNAELQRINMANASPPEPAAEGQPHYVGVATCARCHPGAHEFWLTTSHAHAIDTLEDRGKQYDRSCIGCHVTGYEQPGGSTLGHTDGLANVQCEQCHGPGSMHAENPTLVNVPTGVQLAVPEATCGSCHNEEHSPAFDYDTYVPMVLGPGHGGG